MVQKHMHIKDNVSQINHRQQGSVLTISLFILLVITIVGATAINDTVMEEKMSSNFQNGHAAFQAAESSINRTVIAIAQNRDLVVAAMDANDAAKQNSTTPEWPTTPTHTMTRSDSGSDSNAHSSTTLNATVRYVGENKFPPAGCTTVLGRPNACMAVVVDVVGSGAVVNTNVTRTHIQGTQKILPSGG